MTEAIEQRPVPLHLPAILQNPTNPALRQVAAYNAQQREKALARREKLKQPTDTSTEFNGRGKRFVRRKDNAAFAFNPHITAPTRSDFAPPVPLHHRRIQATFPPSAVARSVSAPDAVAVSKDPFSSDSRSGAFSTSLKGTRALLRNRGRRAETLVGIVEGSIRDWLNGDRLGSTPDGQSWSTIDSTLVNFSATHAESPGGLASSPPSAPGSSRRMPAHHQVTNQLPPLPIENGRLPAILELSRSPAHLTWAANDGFDRLVVHLVVRYYELISWSDDHRTTNNQGVRLTHIVLPSLTQPKLPSHALLTPETSDLSAPSSSDTDNSSDTASEAGSDGTEVGYSLDPDISQSTIILEDAMGHLDLHRTTSVSSSMYASSEGGSDGMLDSLILPPPPANGGGWTMVMSDTETSSDIGDLELPVRPTRTMALGRMGARGWEERPTFFEYLYGE